MHFFLKTQRKTWYLGDERWRFISTGTLHCMILQLLVIFNLFSPLGRAAAARRSFLCLRVCRLRVFHLTDGIQL